MAADPRTLLYKNAAPTGEAARAQRLAEQYGFEFVNLDHFQVDHQLFKDVPLELMIRYQLLPEKRENGSTSATTAPSFLASRSCRSSTSPRSACRRTAVLNCVSPAAPSTSASRSSPPRTARIRSSASWTRSR